jgi:hypothetical protein
VDAVRQIQQGTAFKDTGRTNEGQYLPKLARVDQCRADRAIPEMIGSVSATPSRSKPR